MYMMGRILTGEFSPKSEEMPRVLAAAGKNIKSAVEDSKRMIADTSTGIIMMKPIIQFRQ